MGFSLGDLKKRVLLLVQKTPGYQGWYTDEKVTEVINEALDFMSVQMFDSGEGWLREIRYLDWSASTRVLSIPEDVAIINNLRWKVGDQYQPLKYDPADVVPQSVKGTVSAIPATYRIVQNKIYFNPEPSESGTAMIELEFSRYPQRMVANGQETMPDFDNAMIHWLKYYCANTMMVGAGKSASYVKNEAQWETQMQKIIDLRNRVKKVIQDFGE